MNYSLVILVLLASVYVTLSHRNVIQHYYHCIKNCACKKCVYTMYNFPFTDGRRDTDRGGDATYVDMKNQEKIKNFSRCCVELELRVGSLISKQPGVDVKTVINVNKKRFKYLLTKFGVKVLSKTHLLFSGSGCATLQICLGNMNKQMRFHLKHFGCQRITQVSGYDCISKPLSRCMHSVAGNMCGNPKGMMWIQWNKKGNFSIGDGDVPGHKAVVEYHCPSYPTGKPVSEIVLEKYTSKPLNVTIYS